MSINAHPEYFKAEEEYRKAKTKEDKIAALEELIRVAPKHKGAEGLLMQLKTKLKKLREKPASKSSRKMTTIPKGGDVMVCLIGQTQSGKSTLLSKMTNVRPKISDVPFTTVKPVTGVADWRGVKVQIVEIPSKFEPVYMSIAKNADAIIFVYNPSKDLRAQRAELNAVAERFKLTNPSINVLGRKDANLDDIYRKLWSKFGLIKIYTKEPDKEPQKRAMVMPRGSTVKDAARRLHRDFIDFFKFARVWGRSAKHSGEKVGLDYVLEDEDVLEIRIS